MLQKLTSTELTLSAGGAFRPQTAELLPEDEAASAHLLTLLRRRDRFTRLGQYTSAHAVSELILDYVLGPEPEGVA